ncbi:cytochrome P450 oxidoreductase [Thozetella sp. PMI_491]|nr:cytochrome P450 oxidoreductase [Thozetella sp. PMI_491]
MKNRFNGRLSSIPGPFVNSITVLPRLLSVYRGKSHLEDLAMHKRYGKIVRLAPNTVSITDISCYDAIYGITSHFYKGGFYEPVRFYDEEGLIPDPFVMSDKAMHSRMKPVVRMESLVDQVIENLIKRLDDEYVTKGQICDIGSYMLFFSMDAIFSVTFGKSTDLIGKGDEKGLCQNLRALLPYIACVGQIPWAHRFLMGNSYVANWLSGPGDALVSEVMRIAVEQRADFEKTIDRNDNHKASSTFLMRLLRNQAENPASITDREVTSHTFGNITAGGDTTATTLRAVLYYLINNPKAAERLRSELQAAGLGKDSPVISYNDAAKVPYLGAVIREAMRLHPSVGMIIARTVPQGGVTLTSESGRKYHIGAGVEIGVNPWILHRDPIVFPEPESYKPERWLEADRDHLAQMNKSWMPFGGGRHTCSGQHISMLEVTKLIPSLILRYDLQWAKENMSIKVENYFFTAQDDMKVRLTRAATKP